MPPRMLILSALALLCSVACARAAPPNVDIAVQDDAIVLGFLDGAPLTPTEQQAVAAYVRDRSARDPKMAADVAAGSAIAARVIAGTDPRKRAIVREMYRAQIETRPAADAERQIVEAHDPTIAFDPKTGFVVSEHALDEVMAAVTWATRVLGVTAPPDLRADARTGIAAQFTRLDRANQAAYAHIERNIAIGLPILGHEPPAAQKAALLRWGKPDNGHALLAMTTSALSTAAAQATSGAGAGGSRFGNPALQILHGMTMRNLAQGTWQMRHPECGPVGGDPSDCAGAPNLQPITPPFP